MISTAILEHRLVTPERLLMRGGDDLSKTYPQAQQTHNAAKSAWCPGRDPSRVYRARIDPGQMAHRRYPGVPGHLEAASGTDHRRAARIRGFVQSAGLGAGCLLRDVKMAAAMPKVRPWESNNQKTALS